MVDISNYSYTYNIVISLITRYIYICCPNHMDSDSVNLRFRSRDKGYLSSIIVTTASLFPFLDYSKSFSNQLSGERSSISNCL